MIEDKSSKIFRILKIYIASKGKRAVHKTAADISKELTEKYGEGYSLSNVRLAIQEHYPAYRRHLVEKNIIHSDAELGQFCTDIKRARVKYQLTQADKDYIRDLFLYDKLTNKSELLKKLNEHGIKMSYSSLTRYLEEKEFTITTEDEKDINFNKVNDAITYLHTHRQKVTVRAISKICGLSVGTVQKYKSLLEIGIEPDKRQAPIERLKAEYEEHHEDEYYIEDEYKEDKYS